MNKISTPYQNLSRLGKISRSSKDIGWEVVRGIGNGVVMAPKNLIHQIRGETTEIEWIASRKEDRETRRPKPAEEVNVNKGVKFQPTLTLLPETAPDLLWRKRLDVSKSEYSTSADDTSQWTSEDSSTTSAEAPLKGAMSNGPSVLAEDPPKLIREPILIESVEMEKWEHGRAKCEVLHSEHYAEAVLVHFHPDSLQTHTRMMVLEFDGDQAFEKREQALELLNERLKKLDPSWTWKDLPGIKKAPIVKKSGIQVPGLRINYQPKFAEFLAHALGFPISKEEYQDRYQLQRWNRDFLKAADQVRDELSYLWKTQTQDVPLGKRALPPGGSIFNSSANRATYAKTIDALMKNNFIIGEFHGGAASHNFILQNMRRLRQEGFTTCYVENLPRELQSQVNAYLNGGPDAKMSMELKLSAYAMGMNEILVAAKEEGIRVLGADSGVARRDGKVPEAPFNHMLLSLIEFDAENRKGGKFFALVGGAHAGVARIIKDCTSLFISQFRDLDKQIDEFIITSFDRRSELAENHPCKKFFSFVDCDLYIATSNPLEMSIEHERSEHIYKPHGERPHSRELFTDLVELMQAIDENNFNTIRQILKSNNTLVKWRNEGLVSLALSKRKFDVLQELTKCGADINEVDSNGWTKLMLASAANSLHVVDILCRIGADLNIKNNNGQTALMLACAKGRKAVAKHLSLEADINIQDNSGKTALHIATEHGHHGIVEILLDNGADPRLLDGAGRTASELAKVQ